VEAKKLAASAFLFDMDGTLVDSGAAVEAAWALWSARHGLDLVQVLAYSHGRPTLATMQHFGERFAPGKDWRDEAQELQELETSQATKSKPIAGALKLIEQLEGAPWAVVTSAPRQLAETRIQGAGLPLPRVLVPSDEVAKGKPHPEGFLKAARILNVAAGRCVVFEDTPPGIEAGLSAGMQVIGLLTTVTAERLRTTNLIRDYSDLRVNRCEDYFEIEIGRW
jgi:sugar-phosphatase